MPNPLLALQVQPANIDVAGSLARGQEVQSAKLGNILQQFKLQQAQKAEISANALASLYQQHGAGIAAGNEDDLNALASVNPELAMDYRGKKLTQDKTSLDISKTKGEIAKADYDLKASKMSHGASLLGAVLDAPDNAKPLVYQWMLKQAADEGLDNSNLPQTYTPDVLPVLGAHRQSILTAKEQLENQQKASDALEKKRVDDATIANQRGQLGVAQGRLNMERDNANRPDFNAPATVEISDGKGGTKTVLAQQNKKSGQWVTADEKRTPLDATNINIASSANGTGGARTQVQMLRMLSAAHTIGNELENVAALPSGATAGMFSGLNNTSPRGMLTREVTPEDIQSYNTVNTGLSRALGQLEAAGLAPPGSLVHQMEGLTLQKGDTESNRLQKLATVRQTAEGILDSVANSPIASKKQIDEINLLKDRFSKAIPFTPMDVIKLERKANPNGKTVSQMATDMGLGPQPEQGKTPSGASVSNWPGTR